jgi:hypothetical protein
LHFYELNILFDRLDRAPEHAPILLLAMVARRSWVCFFSRQSPQAANPRPVMDDLFFQVRVNVGGRLRSAWVLTRTKLHRHGTEALMQTLRRDSASPRTFHLIQSGFIRLAAERTG